tara:strand:+ start:107 stop:367 length:261 start_codon:yes stop_codon:yes gene_type:complete
MKNFRVQIHYENYHGETNVLSEDSVEGIEKSVLDKLGKNEVKFESNGFTRGKWITYEEVINDGRPIHYEKVLGTRLAKRAPEVRKT